MAQIKQSIALAIRKRDDPTRVLLVRRPKDDAEFPDRWGLPAASLHQGETLEEAALRIGAQKLRARLRLGQSLAEGAQQRAEHTIEMRLYEAWLEEGEPVLPAAGSISSSVTLYTDWRWGEPGDLLDSAHNGSLCSQLLLEYHGSRGSGQQPLQVD